MLKLIIDGARMQEVLHSPRGPVARALMVRATVFQAAARHQAHRKTGCLQDSIVKRFEDLGPLGFVIRIVCDTTPCSPKRVSYAWWHHEGTPAHVIVAVNASVLAFDWPAGPTGGMFFAYSVNHPGTPANKFFSDNLHIFAV